MLPGGILGASGLAPGEAAVAEWAPGSRLGRREMSRPPASSPRQPQPAPGNAAQGHTGAKQSVATPARISKRGLWRGPLPTPRPEFGYKP